MHTVFLGLLLSVAGQVNVPNYEQEDFYYQDESGKHVVLGLTNKVVIAFDRGLTNDERSELLAKLGKDVTDIEILDPQRIIIALGPVEDVLTFINAHNQDSEKMKLQPVVLVDGREATLTNMLKVRTVDAINAERLDNILSEMDIGIFNVAGSTPTERVYYVAVNKLNLPINFLILANMISEKPWVRYAQPVFENLSFPISAKFLVLPNGAPTLGEKRTLVIEVTVDDEKVSLKEDDIPQLGQGSFMITGINASPANSVFFKFEECSREFTQVGNKKTWTLSWPFYCYSVGRYSFSALNLPVDGIEGGVFHFSPISFDFVVNSVTSAAMPPVVDIQPIKNRAANFGSIQSVEVAELENVGRWFVPQVVVSGALLAFGVLIWLWPLAGVVTALVSNMKKKRESRNILLEKLNKFSSCLSHDYHRDFREQYQKLETILRQFLFLFDIPENISANELSKRHLEYGQVVVMCCLQELDKRHDPEYISSDNSMKLFKECIEICRVHVQKRRS